MSSPEKRQIAAKPVSHQFILFLINGSILGLVAWAVQQGIFNLMGGITGAEYAFAAVISYPPYAIQRRHIFAQSGRFPRFVFVKFIIMALVSLLSPVMRWGVSCFLGGLWGNRVGFIAAALAVAPVSFILNRVWVFQNSN